jgi:hypothetical protein
VVEFDVVPALSDEVRRVLAHALEASSEDHAPAEVRLTSRWWRAGVQEGAEAPEEPDPTYALSPRSTRGATRA